MTSPVPSSDSDTLTLEPTSEAKDQVSALPVPPLEGPKSPSAAYRLMKRDSGDSGADVRRVSEASSTGKEGESSDDVTRRPSLISKTSTDKESDPGLGTHPDASRQTSIDQGFQEGKKMPPLLKGDSMDSTGSDPKSDPINPVVSDDSGSGQQLSSGHMGSGPSSIPSNVTSSDGSGPHPDLPRSDSDPSRSEDPPRSGLESALQVAAKDEIALLPIHTPDLKSALTVTNVTITSAADRQSRDGSFPATVIMRQAPTPRPPKVDSYNDVMFTVSKIGTYTFGILYLSGLYGDFWFENVPYELESIKLALSYMISLVCFSLFCLIDSTRVPWYWLIPSLTGTSSLNGFFIYDFDAYRYWWFYFSMLHITCMTLYFISIFNDATSIDLVRAHIRYQIDRRNHVRLESELVPIQDPSNVEQGQGSSLIRPASRTSLGPGRLNPNGSDDETTPLRQIAEVQVHAH